MSKFSFIMKPSNIRVSAIAVLLLVALLPISEAAVSCSDVAKALSPCLKYLVNGSGAPPTACCTGASKLASTVTTSADKKTACGCIKTTAQKIKPNDALAKALPGNCGISLPFTISSSVDCTKIS